MPAVGQRGGRAVPGLAAGARGRQQAPEDPWGNVKIPYLEKLDVSTADRDGWVPVPTSGVPYSSLLGLLVIGRASYSFY